MSPPQELTYGDWNSDTATSSNVDIQGDTFTLAPRTVIIDNFNDGDTSSYQGQTSQISDVTSNPEPYEGSHCGLVSGNIANDIIALTGFSFSSPVRVEGVHRHVENAGTCLWALLNSFGGDTSSTDGDDPGYWMYFDGGTGDIKLAAGSGSDVLPNNEDASGTTSIGYDTWTEWSLTIENGTATFNYGGTEISSSNTPYSSFVGWGSYTYRSSAFDNIRYTSL